MTDSLKANIISRALELGFDLIGFAPLVDATAPDATSALTPHHSAFMRWLAQGYHAEMGYLAREPQKRADPRLVLLNAQTAIVVGVSYDTLAVPMSALADPSRGRIARYAWGADYHDVLTPRLRALGEFVSRENRAYVDTGPVLERAWAEQAGLGFIGKNTCLIHRTRGSYFFLGVVFVAAEIETAPPPTPASRPKALCGCGACTRCITACPTQAFAAPYVLNAQRCISYLTIELKGAIPVAMRPQLGNWLFGCDICQDVCPYVRRYSHPSREQAFYPVNVDRAAPNLLDVLSWDHPTFNAKFKGTPLSRAKRRGIVRNACVAAGNWGNAAAIPALTQLLTDEEALVREHAQWAIERIESTR
ncbi:MAG: tRNA epoxyqueuosine(34) reductase QueG [Anaerolineae bacterium]|nr:tRNA epoxyqueuosine(34) reductase QueG [Anaerolineae bacterium]